MVVAAGGGTARLLVSHPATESKHSFRLTANGWLLYLTGPETATYTFLDLEKGDLRRLTYDDGADNLDAWSPDGKWIYFLQTPATSPV